VVGCALFADVIAPANPYIGNLDYFLLPPSKDFPVGTDALGRDILSRIIYGSRVSLFVGLASVVLAGAIGVYLGIVSAMFRGWLGEAIMRVADTFLTLPAVLIALAVAATIGPSMTNIILIIGLLYWAQFARMVRGEVLSIREREYVEAAKALGCSTFRLMWRHILPNLVNNIIVISTLQLAAAIILEATLSFLGVGVPPPTPSWGTMVAEGRPYISTAWWIVTFPGLTILFTVLSINLLGDWLRDRLDPKLKRIR
jgi:peptide/nickel transport system permease protein